MGSQLTPGGELENVPLVRCVGLRRGCGFSKYANRGGAKSVRGLFGNLLAFLTHRHLRVFEKRKTIYMLQAKELAPTS